MIKWLMKENACLEGVFKWIQIFSRLLLVFKKKKVINHTPNVIQYKVTHNDLSKHCFSVSGVCACVFVKTHPGKQEIVCL